MTMASSINRDEGPVYYREIQKNAYLKRIPNEPSGSKLRPLGHKKPPLKPMWTLFCVHNGRTPFLEQYPEPDSASALTHRPTWRACLRTARHVTASVKPRTNDEHDFLIDTDHGPVRMLAPDWESMQDWVTCLRNKLHELKILRASENVYVSPPVAPPPRAGTRDPTSPLPPTPPVPPDRVPGIELTTQVTRPTTTITEQPSQIPENPEAPQNTTTTLLNMENQETVENRENISEIVDISNWDTSFHSLPSTSQDSQKIEPKKSVAKICGQNICLDDSILKRASNTTDSDEDFFAEIDRIHDSVENLDFRENIGESRENFSSSGGYKQRVLVNNDVGKPSCSVASNNCSEFPATNVTVIKVSNKGPPHTAIPVLGPETDIFDFDFKPKESTSTETSPGTEENFINIVNTEVDVQNTAENGYGTVFSENDNADYGHLSLTTTVSLTGVSDVTTVNSDVTAVSSDVTAANDSLYERLCMASTSEASPRPVRRLKSMEKSRKSSLPNLECTDATYEYLFPNQNNNRNMSNVTLNGTENQNRVNVTEINSNNHNDLSNEVSRAMNIQVNVTVGANLNSNARLLRSNVERSHSQNAYDSSPRLRDQLIRRVQNCSPKRDAKNDKTESNQAKPIWKRGLTELSLLSKLRGFGQGKRQESPTRHENDNNERSVTSPVKVVHRSRPETRVDNTRRRSSSLSNGQSPPASSATPACPLLQPLQPLRQRQAAALRAEQRRGAAVAATIPARDPPMFCDYNRQVWVAWWSRSGSWCAGRTGDRVAALRGTPPRDAQHARQLLKTPAHTVDILFHRVPLGKIYVLNKRDHESLGIKLDNECNITSVETQSPAGRAGLPPPGKWALTEVNNRPINLIKGGEEEMNRLSMHGSEVSILIQPSPLVKKIRAAIKANKPILAIR